MKAHVARCRRIAMVLAALLVSTSAVPRSNAAETTERKQAVVSVEGLACPFCVFGLKRQLSKIRGVEAVEVDLGGGQAVLDLAPDAKVTEDQIRKAVRDAGFTPGKVEWRAAGGKAGSKQRSSAAETDGSAGTATFVIEGMRCEHCTTNLSTALQKLSGVRDARVDWRNGRATVEYDRSQTGPDEMTRTIEGAGRFRARQGRAPQSGDRATP